jgi:ubiquinone/menaquinone biosynthesis C-methylase UbiE
MRGHHHVCPWWLGYVIDNPIRRWIHPPKMLGEWVAPGMTVLDVGCGHGLFSLGMARLVGPEGKVIALDMQERMLDVVRARADKAGLDGRVDTRRAEAPGLGLDERVDFVLAFYVVHEVLDQEGLLRELAGALRPSGRLLLAEPVIHWPRSHFDEQLKMAAEFGLELLEEPRIRFSHAALLGPKGAAAEGEAGDGPRGEE